MKPTLLLFDDLVEPINNVINELETINTKIDILPNQDFILRGTFVYSISLFESSITECLKRFLLAFPSKLSDGQVSGKESKYLDDVVFASEVIEFVVDDFINKFTYENVNEIMSRTFKLLEIDPKNIKFNKKDLVEKKERRNILVHNNLIIDKTYIRNTKCEPTNLRKNLTITNDYLIDSIKLSISILKQVHEELHSKYGKYNKSKLLRNVWNYVFDSKILKYESYWNEDDCFIFENKKEFDISWLSSGEKTMLSYWIQHYSPDIVDRYFKFKDMQMATYHMKRMNFLVEFFNKYPYILQ